MLTIAAIAGACVRRRRGSRRCDIASAPSRRGSGFRRAHARQLPVDVEYPRLVSLVGRRARIDLEGALVGRRRGALDLNEVVPDVATLQRRRQPQTRCRSCADALEVTKEAVVARQRTLTRDEGEA